MDERFEIEPPPAPPWWRTWRVIPVIALLLQCVATGYRTWEINRLSLRCVRLENCLRLSNGETRFVPWIWDGPRVVEVRGTFRGERFRALISDVNLHRQEVFFFDPKSKLYTTTTDLPLREYVRETARLRGYYSDPTSD